MKLFFDDERGQRSAFPLTGSKVTIGRSSDCDLVLVDDRVSRIHAWLDHVAGQFLVQDAGSSNGTFLNGMRLRAQTSCALREGDVLEIGNTRFLYGEANEDGAKTPAEAVGEISEGAFPLLDLIRDGGSRGAELAEMRADFLRAFVGVSPVVGLERCLEVVAGRVSIDSVAVFMRGINESLQAIAWRPGADVARGLASIARRAWTTQEGRLIRGFVGGAEAAEIRETAVRPLYSAAAVPFLDGDVLLGVLAVERVHEKRLDRGELAQLAIMAEAIGRTLALGDRNPDDTRVGGGATRTATGTASEATLK